MEGLLERFVDNAVSINKLKAERHEIRRALDEEAKKYILHKHTKDASCIEDFDAQFRDLNVLYLKGGAELRCYRVQEENMWFLRFFGHNGDAEVGLDGTIDLDSGLTAEEREFLAKHYKALFDVAEALQDEWFTYKYDREKYIRNILNK
jgi:hypothetical protein